LLAKRVNKRQHKKYGSWIFYTGRDGFPGQKGDKGAFGSQGVPGSPGPKGEEGAIGEQGTAGATGPSGSPGTKGNSGVDGAKGVKGDDGIQGTKGASGVQGIRGVPGLPGTTSVAESGAVYTRWGRHTCESVSVTLYEGIVKHVCIIVGWICGNLYDRVIVFICSLISGFAGGSYYSHTGGGVNYQCLPLKDPQYNKYYTGSATWSGGWIHGVEYEFVAGTGIFPDAAKDQNVPCARCYTKTRSAVVMIPAKRQCPVTWTEEYEGKSNE